MNKNKIISIVLSVAIAYMSIFAAPAAKAQWVVFDPANVVQSTISAIKDIANEIWNLAVYATQHVTAVTVSLVKIAAIIAVQISVAKITGEGSGLIIRDYKNYLYTAPRQRALSQMNNYFNSISKGRLSAYNYEGVGPNYDAFLAGQSQELFTKRTMETNLQEQVTNPKDLFAIGNMKGLSAYLECANNIACYTLNASNEFEKSITMMQDVSRSEQKDGMLPRKDDSGRIVSPALMAENALTDLDEIGTDLIVTADAGNGGPGDLAAALTQIAEGSALSIGARALNYGIRDNRAMSFIAFDEEEFPFSLSY